MNLSIKNISHHLAKFLEYSIPVKLIKQPSTKTCWAACYKMVDSFYARKNDWCFYINFQNGTCSECTRPIGKCNIERKTSDVLNDWRINLGYKKTAHINRAIPISKIRESIRYKRPIQAFVNYPGHAIGHYILIIGTSRSVMADTTLIVLDPLRNTVEPIEFSEMNIDWHWQQTWIIEA